MPRSITPFLWLLFSAGGTVAALLFPVHILLTGLAVPLGWVNAPSYESVLGLVRNPVARLYLFVFVSLPLFHWARSEEHTSELQSRGHLVCRLLLEKKKSATY